MCACQDHLIKTKVIKLFQNKTTIQMHYFLPEVIYTDIIGEPTIFQVNYTKSRNLANYALGVTLSISDSMLNISEARIYNIMNLATTRIISSGCKPGKRRRRKRSNDVLKYVSMP